MSAAPQHCEPIVLLGVHRRQRLSQLLKQMIEQWRQQWSGDTHTGFEVNVAEALCRRSSLSGGRALALGADTPREHLLVIAVPAEMQHELLGVLAPRMAAVGGETANAVFAEALQALCLQLTRLQSNDGVSVTALKGEKLSQAWGRYALTVTVTSGADRVLMRARLSPQMLLAMLPSQAAKSTEPLASRRSAIGTATVPVQAWLGQAEVTLGELADLQVGDVILLDASVTGAGHLALPDGRQLMQIRLGSAAGRRAVSVVGKNGGAAVTSRSA